MKLFLKIRYCGTAYAGYQVQHNAKTVQGELNKALWDLFGFECDVTGCSRTDAGVHALCFCATVTERGKSGIDTRIPSDKIPYAINFRLPSDISVLSATMVDESFHARYSVINKTYIYRILNTTQRDPFEENRAFHYSRPITDEVLSRMNAAAMHICGTHDFSSFMASGSSVKSTVRTVTDCCVKRNGNIVTVSISADGFLYNMVRIICGTLLEVANSNISPDQIPQIINSRDRTLAGPTLPAHGLYLSEVTY